MSMEVLAIPAPIEESIPGSLDLHQPWGPGVTLLAHSKCPSIMLPLAMLQLWASIVYSAGFKTPYILLPTLKKPFPGVLEPVGELSSFLHPSLLTPTLGYLCPCYLFSATNQATCDVVIGILPAEQE